MSDPPITPLSGPPEARQPSEEAAATAAPDLAPTPPDAGSPPAREAPRQALDPVSLAAIAAASTPPPKRSALRSLGDFFWASLVGASLGLLLFGLLLLLDDTGAIRFLDRHPVATLVSVTLASLTLTLRKGFPSRASSYGALVGRALGASLLGLAQFLLALGLIVLADDALDLSKTGVTWLLMALGAVLLVVSWTRVSRARKRKAAGLDRDTRLDPASNPLLEELTPRERSATPYIWAGLFGAGLLAWIMGVLFALERADLYSLRSRDRTPVFFLALLFTLAVTSVRAYPARIRRSFSFLRRVLLGSLFGALAGLALLLLLVAADVGFGLRNDSMVTLLLVASLVMIAAGFYQARELGSEAQRGRAARIEAFVLAAFLVGGVLWPQSSWMRYALGSAEGARSLAEEHRGRGDSPRAARFFEIACERGDLEACAMTAHIHQNGLGVPSSFQRAQAFIALACGSGDECSDLAGNSSLRFAQPMLLARACKLGDKSACDRSQRMVLGSRCDSRDAYACTELGDYMSSREGPSSTVQELYKKACSFGNAAACSRQ